MSGMNIAYEFLNRERTAKVDKSGKLLGIWIRGKNKQNKHVEGKEMWDKIFTMENGAVNFFYSDKPVEAMMARNML